MLYQCVSTAVHRVRTLEQLYQTKRDQLDAERYALGDLPIPKQLQDDIANHNLAVAKTLSHLIQFATDEDAFMDAGLDLMACTD